MSEFPLSCNYSKCAQNKMFLVGKYEYNYVLLLLLVVVVVMKKMTKSQKRMFRHGNLL